MVSLKRTAASDFEFRSKFKKSCMVPVCDIPIRRAPTYDKAPSTPVQTPKTSGQASRAHSMITRAITTRHSTDAVLNTYELLEAILCELPMDRILEARQVSKTWKAIIKQSKPLRTKLFLEAEPRKCLWVLDRDTLQLKPYEWGAREEFGEEWMQGQALSRPSIVNPLVFRHDPILRSALQIRALVCEGLHFTASPDLAKRASLIHEMFVTQPPVSVVQFTFYFNASKTPGKHYRRADDHRTVRIVKESGVRFGHILAAFRIEAARTPEYRLSSKLSIKVHSSSPTCKSVVYMMGAVFVDEEEREEIEQHREKRVREKNEQEPGWVEDILCLKE